jgi:N-acetylglutamate synthase-like GNAT family acetyltransferase
MEYKVADFASPEQLASIELRLRVLRWPLGLDFTPEQLAAEVHDLHLIALDNENLVACLVLTPQSSSVIKMRQVAVEPELQGKGVGTALVAFSERVAREKGYSRMVLHARDTAVPFYLRLDYEIEGEPFEEVTIPHRKMAKDL